MQCKYTGMFIGVESDSAQRPRMNSKWMDEFGVHKTTGMESLHPVWLFPENVQKCFEESLELTDIYLSCPLL